MKKTKNLLAILLSLVLCIGLLGGCGGEKQSSAGNDANNSGNAGGNETAGNNEAAENEGDVVDRDPYEIVIELMCFGTAPADMNEVTEAINAITQPAINATVKFMAVTPADHATKLSLLAAGGEKFDLVVPGVTVSPANLVADGILTDLTDLVGQYAPDMIEKEGGLLAAGTFDGKIYTLSGSLYPGRKVGLSYNKDMAEQYGIEIPESLDTWEDWDAFFAQAKEKLPEGVYPITLGDGGAQNHFNFAYFDALGETNYLTYGVLPDIENGTEIVNWYTTDEYRTTLEKKRQWYEAGYCVPDSMTSGFAANDCIQAGLCFTKIDGLSANKNEANPGPGLSVNLGCITLTPSATITNSDIYIYNWGIPITSEKPERVLEFINLMFTNTDLANLLNFGIEGEHYVLTSEDSKVITYPEGVNSANVGWAGAPAWYGDHATSYVLTPNTEAYYDLIGEYGVEKSRLSNALGYTFDTSNVKTQLAAVQTVIDTYRPSLECGLVDVDTELPKFIQALEDAGISEVIAENQKQFTEWLSTK